MKNTPSRGTIFKLAAIIAFFALPVVGAYLYISFPDGAASAAPPPQEVAHDASSFSDDQAQFFDYQTSDGIKVMYFVVQGQDGVIRAAFDACDECWQSGKGYYQQGDAMVCRKCDQRFPLSSINEVKPGCNPVPLTVTVANNKVVLDPRSLTDGRQYFARSGGGIGGPQCGGGGCGGCGGGKTPAPQAKGGCC